MKKLFYSLIGFFILSLSYVNRNEKAIGKSIEKQGSENLVLKPYQLFGVLWSCSPDDPDEPHGGGSTHYSSSHQSHQSHSSHSSHYSSR